METSLNGPIYQYTWRGAMKLGDAHKLRGYSIVSSGDDVTRVTRVTQGPVGPRPWRWDWSKDNFYTIIS